ncbi:MAG TPA: PQQ-binding-like beta-propeller repeat protein [Gaiellaceae bacterium]|nr:PQQ-binding-like beta-propeller repeat protein [Gaiellaceae bacterium]
MTRRLIVVLTALATAVATSAGAAVSLSAGGVRPTAPRILGPRSTTDRTPTFRFVSREPGLSSRGLRFRCAFDSTRLHRCPGRYTTVLRLGRHTLRVRAVDPSGRSSGTSLARVSVVRPAPHADQTIRVGDAPYNVAVGFGSVWVTVSEGLVRLDPATGAILARIDIGGRPWGVAVGEGAVWVGNLSDGTVTRIDPVTNAVAWRVTLDNPLGQGSPVGVAAGDGSVWAADNSSDEVWRLDPATGGILGTAHVGDAHEFVGFGESGVWISSEDGTIGELDPATGTVTRTIRAGADADFLGFSPGSVWVTNYGSEFLWHIDPATGAVAARLQIGAGAQGVAFDGSSLWIAMYGSGQVLRVDPATGKVLRRVVVGRKPRGIAVAGGSVWVANSVPGTVSRIRIP